MKVLANILTGFVAVFHIFVMVVEMFLWKTLGAQLFELTPEQANATAQLAGNQGLYNGFLVAGLGWALFSDRRDLKIFFLGCVIVAGLYGGLTTKTSILFTQALPAALALGAVLLSARQNQR